MGIPDESFYHCMKNPYHKGFIPFDDLGIQDLPGVGQKSELLHLIKCQGALIVRVACNSRCSSSKRTVGRTGFVTSVFKRTAGIGQSCNCDECLLNHKGVTHHEWYELTIVTFDVDDQNQIDTNSSIDIDLKVKVNLNEWQKKKLELKKETYKYVKVNEAICQLHFTTYDIELGSHLHSNFVQFQKLQSNAYSLISKDSEDLFSFIISHPHGADKQVSFSYEKHPFHSSDGSGRQKTGTNWGNVLCPSSGDYASVSYNTPTCPGSGGAIVTTLTEKGIIVCLHLGSFTPGSVKTVCLSEYLENDKEPDQSEDFGPMIKYPSRSKEGGMATSTSEVGCGPEADGFLSSVVCEKYPGHKEFFPMQELTLGHLPENHRKEDILRIIHHTGTLTVKVRTSFVSWGRPDEHPHISKPEHSGVSKPYPFSEAKGTNYLHLGTGFVVNVQEENVKDGQTCQCNGQESGESVPGRCYKIVVMTAIHAVFDQAEANATEVHFSCYERGKKVTTKILKGKCKYCVMNEDVCWLEYSTHDETLVSKLRESLEQFQKGRLVLSKSREHDELVIIVSHPHGSTKQHVSFGNIVRETDIHALKEPQNFLCLLFRVIAFRIGHSRCPFLQALHNISSKVLQQMPFLMLGRKTGQADTSEETPGQVDTSKAKLGQKETDAEQSSHHTKSPAFRFFHPLERVVLWPRNQFHPIACQQIPEVYYTTPTCPVSSGALVCIHKPGVGNVICTHWGKEDGMPWGIKINRSGGGTVFLGNDNQLFPS